MNTLLRGFDIETQNDEENIWICINAKLHVIFGYDEYLDFSNLTEEDKFKALQLIQTLNYSKFNDKFPIISWVQKVANTLGDDWETKIANYFDYSNKVFDDNFEDIINSDDPDTFESKTNKKKGILVFNHFYWFKFALK